MTSKPEPFAEQTAISDLPPQDMPPETPDAGTTPDTDELPTWVQRWNVVIVHTALLLLMGSGLALAGLGQYILATTEEFTPPIPGVVAVILGALLFVGSVFLGSRLRTPDGFAVPHNLQRALAHLSPYRWSFAALAGAMGLLVWQLSVLDYRDRVTDYNWTVLLWFGAMGLYLLAVYLAHHTDHANEPAADTFGLRQRVRMWLRAHGQLALLISAVMLVGLGLRIWNVGDIPPVLSGDEGSQGIEGLKVISGEIRNPFTTGWLGVPTMSFYLNAGSIVLFNNTMFALRLPWVLVGTAAVLAVFFLVYRLQGLTLALVTTVLLATYHYHIHYSRLGSVQIADTLFVALALLFLYRGYERRSLMDWALCGIVIGVAQYFYAGARFTGIVVVAVVLFLAVRDGLPFVRQRYREMLVLVGAVLISGGAMIQYALLYPEEYNARLSQVGIFQSGWLEREQEILGQGALTILWDQFQRTMLAFNFYPDRTVWYGLPEPLLDPLAGVLFVLGFSYATLRLFDRRMFPLVAWWGGAMILGGVITESPPSSQRLVTTAAPTMFFVALALVKIAQILVLSLDARRAAVIRTVFLTTSVVVLSVISVRLYFVEFTPTYRAGGYNAMVATSVGHFASHELGPDWQLVFVGAPRMYAGFGSIPYLAPEVERQDILEPLTGPLDPGTVPRDKHLAFVVLPERQEELGYIRATYPGGVHIDVTSPVPDTEEEVMYTLYLVQRSRYPS